MSSFIKKLLPALALAFPLSALAAAISFGPPPGLSGVESAGGIFSLVLGGLQQIVGYLAAIMIVASGVTFAIAAVNGDSAMAETAKKMTIATIIGFAVILAAPSFLKQILAITGDYTADIGKAKSFQVIAENILTFLLSVVGIIATIGLVLSGMRYLFAFGDSGQTTEAKASLKWSLVGLAVAASALIILNQLSKFFVS